MLYVWHPKNRTNLNTIHEENDVIGPEELARVNTQLKQGKHTCFIMRMKHPRAYDLLSFITGLLQDSYKFSIIYKSPIKRLEDSYQEIARLLPSDCRTPINFL